MKRALFTSRNLIGDGLYIQPALAQWAAEHPDWYIDLLTNNDHITTIYKGMGIRGMRIIYERGQEAYDFEHVFDVSAAFALGDQEKLHISEAYARPLGIELPKILPRVHFTPQESEVEEGVILLSMFSNSCASREGKAPNKMLSWAVWMAVLILVRQLGPVRFLGGPNDKAELLPMKDEELLLGRSMDHIAETMRKAKLLITIDNGMGHLAATQGTPTILFYPACLGQHWIIPSGNSNMVVCPEIDPVRFTVLEGLLVVREGIKNLLMRREHQHEEQNEVKNESEKSIETEVTGQQESGQEEDKTESSPSSVGSPGILPGGYGDDDTGRQ